MRTSCRLLIVVCALLLGTLSRAVWATTYTWQAGGGTIDWGDVGNWAGGTAPVSNLLTTDVIFGNAGTNVFSRIAPNFSIRSLTFTSDASIYTFSGGPLRIGAGGITHDAFNEQTFGTAQIVLGANQTWSLGSNAGALRLSANVDMAGRTLTINAARTTGNGNVVDGNFLGAGALIKTGAGILTLGAAGSTYTGGTTINEGVLAFSNGGAFGTGSVSLAGGELRATVNATLAQTVVVAAGMTGTISAATGANLTLNALGVFGDLAIGSAGNTGTVTMNLSTYVGSSDAGTVSINAGTVRLSTSRFGGLTDHLARTTIASGATLDLNNISLTINNLEGAGSLVMNNIEGGSGDAVEGSSTTLTLYSGDFSGTISGYGSLLKKGSGTLILSGANTFTQGTNLVAGTVGLGNNAALGSGYVRVTGAAALFAHGGDRTLAQRVQLDFESESRLTIGDQPGQAHRLTLAGIIEGSGSLVKNGSGTLVLANYNTFTGGFTLNGGTVEALNEASLGAPENVLTFNAGRLEFIGDTTLTRTYNLSNATTIAPALGRTITYLSSAAVNGGNLGAGGTHEFASGFALNGSTAAVGSRLTTNGNVTFANATLRGAVTQNNGTLAMTNTIFSSAGSLTVNGTAVMDGVESGGVIHVNAGGKVSSTGAALVLASGSRTTIEAGGALVAAPGASIELNGGILRNNGTQTGTLNVNFGSLALGSGTFGSVHVNEGGRFSAGTGTGIVSLQALTLGGGGRYTFELGNTAANTELAGGFLNIAGQLQIDAGNTADTRFTIAIVSPGGLAFDPTQSWTFTLATASGGITGFGAEQFSIDSTGFGSPLNGGSFVVSQSGNDLLLQFAPVPEPSTWAMMLAGTGLLVMLRRWRR